VENVKSFDEFLERRFPESRRKAYYLMSIHEHLPPQAIKELKEVGWTKGVELAKIARRNRQHFEPSSVQSGGTCYLLADGREICVRLAGGRSENLRTHHSGP
jgi:hypothetical protein